MPHHSSTPIRASSPQRGTDRRGFSLVEILSVIVIMGLLMAVVLPKSGVASYQSNSAARVVATALSYAQRQAVSQQADIRVGFDVDNFYLRIHEDRNNDNVIDAGERVTFNSLPEGIAFGRGIAAPRPMGGAAVTFTRTEGGLPIVVFHRDGSASENGGIYLSTIAGLSLGRTADVRTVEVSRATGRPTWYSLATGIWKRGD